MSSLHAVSLVSIRKQTNSIPIVFGLLETNASPEQGRKGGMMSTHTLPRKLLLSTATLIGALAAYGGRAYGQQVCVPPVGTTFTCDGSSSDTQDLTFATTNVDNTNVITDDDFSVNTGDANAITITGAGAISFTDSYSAPYSSLTAGVGYTALFIRSTGDIGGGNAAASRSSPTAR